MTLTVIMVIMIDISKLKHGYNHDHDQGDYTPTYGYPINSYTAGDIFIIFLMIIIVIMMIMIDRSMNIIMIIIREITCPPMDTQATVILLGRSS